MHEDQIHFEFLKRSRRPLVAGDLFTFSIKTRGYFFGRVIIPSVPEDHPLTDAACLLYVYALESPHMSVDVGMIDRRSFLIPPFFTNRKPWTMGYFQTLVNIPLRAQDVLERHCFWDVAFHRYVDEMCRPINERVEPCGIFGVASYSGLSSEIGSALGLPALEAPDDH